MDKIPVKASEQQTHNQAAADTEMTIHNIIPNFSSDEAKEKEKKEIAQQLYRIFSQYT